MQPTRLPKKKDVALALLEQASVFVHLDPRMDKVFVPPWFKNKPQLVLQIGLNMAIPIPDLEVDDAGLSCTLSFNRSPHHCKIPWNAVFALVGDNGRGMVWPDDVPPEVAAEAEKQAKAAQAKAKIQAVAPAPTPAKEPAAAEAKRGAQAESEGDAAAPKPTRRKKAASAGGASKAAASAPKREAKEAKKARTPRKRKPEGPAAPIPAAARVPAAAPEPARSATAGAPSAPKRKRELPPYLRVVK